MVAERNLASIPLSHHLSPPSEGNSYEAASDSCIQTHIHTHNHITHTDPQSGTYNCRYTLRHSPDTCTQGHAHAHSGTHPYTQEDTLGLSCWQRTKTPPTHTLTPPPHTHTKTHAGTDTPGHRQIISLDVRDTQKDTASHVGFQSENLD